MQAAIVASTAAITAHDDALVNGFVRACVDDADLALEGITTKSPDAQMVAATAAASCVNLARNEITAEGPAGVDTLGFALNTVGPVALFLMAYVGQPTDILRQNIIAANIALMAKLQPTCAVTPDVNVHLTIAAHDTSPIPGDVAHAPIPGHGACYNYTRPAPALTDGHLLILPTGAGTGADPWTVTGDGVPEICSFVFWCGDHVDWPTVNDYTIAVNQAMAQTSYPVAAAALHRLKPAVTGPTGAQVAVTTSTATAHGYEAFDIEPTGRLLSSNVAIAQAPSWQPVAGAPELRSIASASNADGRLEMFGTDRLGQIFHRWQRTPADDTSWTPWAQMDGALNSVALARNQDGTLQLFGVNQFGDIWTRHQVLGADRHPAWPSSTPLPAVDFWSPWKQMDGHAIRVAAATDSAARIELYAIGTDGIVYYRFENAPNATDPSLPGYWSAWGSMGMPASSIAVTPGAGGEFQIFATSGTAVNQMTEISVGQFATGWAPVFGLASPDLAVSMSPDNHMLLLGHDPTGTVYTDVATGGYVGGWLGWGPFSGAPLLGVPTPTAGGKVSLSWIDKSSLEDGFGVFRVTPDGTIVSMMLDMGTPNKAGLGETITAVDSAPVADATQRCYEAIAYDYNAVFGGDSTIMCVNA